MPIDEARLQEISKRISQLDAQRQTLTERWQQERDAAHQVIELRAKLHDAVQKNPAPTEPPPEVESQSEESSNNTLATEEKIDLDVLRQQLADADARLTTLQAEESLVQIEVNPDMVAQVAADWTGIPLGKMLRDEAEKGTHGLIVIGRQRDQAWRERLLHKEQF